MLGRSFDFGFFAFLSTKISTPYFNLFFFFCRADQNNNPREAPKKMLKKANLWRWEEDFRVIDDATHSCSSAVGGARSLFFFFISFHRRRITCTRLMPLRNPLNTFMSLATKLPTNSSIIALSLYSLLVFLLLH